ncbi:translocation/assembly module TamB domain-containing protein [Desulfoplanes sp.]
MKPFPFPAALHRILHTTCVVMTVVTALCLGLILLLTTQPGLNLVEHAVNRFQSTVRINNVRGNLLGEFSLERITLADRNATWLTLRGMDCRWQPSKLLHGEVHIPRVRAAEVDLARFPSGPATTNTDGAPAHHKHSDPLPSFFPAITVSEVGIDRLLIGSGNRRKIPPLTLSGSATMQSLQGPARARLHLHPLQEDVPKLELLAHRDRGILGCSGNYTDPQGDMSGFLAGYPEPFPLTIRFQGKGISSNYQGKMAAAAPGMGSADMDLEWSVVEHRGNLGGTILLEPDGRMADVAEWVGERVDVDVGTDMDEQGRQLACRLKISSGRGTLSGTGRIGLEKLRTDADLELRIAEPGRLGEPLGIGLEHLAPLTATVTGSLPTPTFSFSGEAGSLQADQLRIGSPRITLTSTPSSARTSLRYSATLHATASDVILPDILHTGALEIHGGLGDLGGESMDGRLKISSSRFTVNGSGSFAHGPGTLDATFSGRAEPDGLFAPAITPLPDSLDLAGTIRADLFQKRGTVELRTGLGPFSKGPVLLESLFGPSSDLTVTAGIRKNELVIDALSLNGTRVRASGNGTLGLENGEYRADLTGRVQAAALGRDLAHIGTISLESGITGTSDRVSGTLSASPEKGTTVFGIPVDAVSLSTSLHHLETAPTGSWAASLTTPPGPLDMNGNLDLTNGFSIPHATIRGLGLDGTFNLTLPKNTPPKKLGFDLASSSLAPLGTLLDHPLQGSLNMQGSYTDNQGARLLTLTGSAQDLAYGETGKITSLDLKHLTLDPARPDQPDMDMEIKGFTSGSATLETARLRATRLVGRLDIALDAQGTRPAPLHLSLAGHTLPDATDRFLHLSTLQGAYNGLAFTLEHPTELRSKREILECDPFVLNVGDGILSGRGHMDADTINATMDLGHLSLASAQLLSPFPLPAGILEGTASITGPLEHPGLRTDIVIDKLAPIQSDQAEDIPLGTLTLTAATTADRMDASGSLTGLGPSPLHLTAKIPVALSLCPFRASLSRTAPITGSARGDLDLAKIGDILAIPDLDLAGDVRFDTSVSGTMTAPECAGTISLEQGRAEYVRTGTLLEHVQALIRLDGKSLHLATCSATDGEDGSIGAEGRLTLPINVPLAYGVSTTLHGARLVRSDTLTAHVDGICRMHGNATTTSVAGTLTIPRGTMDISHNPDPNMVPLEIRQINVEPGYELETGEEASPPAQVRLDMNVTIPGRFFVRGRGLASEWKGRLQVDGTAATPVTDGTLESVRGSLAFAGRELNLDSGEIQFDGGFPPNPLLDIVTSTDIESTEVQIKIQGSAKSPNMVLESSSGLPEDEILALLLFGQSAAKLNPMQALQLANTARNLAGSSGKSGFDPMEFARSLLGVDTITVGSDDEDGEMQVGVGTYLTDSIYMELEKGLTSDDDAVSVEMELTPNIGVETEVGTDSTGKAGVYWKRDY